MGVKSSGVRDLMFIHRTISRGVIGLLALAGVALAARPALANLAEPPIAAPPAAAPETLDLKKDEELRMTVPVMVDGKGPFPFVIDTGADRTVISRELADQLKLPNGPRANVRGTAGDQEVNTADISMLQIGQRTLSHINAPVLVGSDLGAMGMLGVDTLYDQHIVLDFQHRKMSTEPSRRDDDEFGAVVVRGRYKFGQLILVDARIRGVFVYVILDTGAQGSIGNSVLQKMLHATDRAGATQLSTEIISVTGQSTPAELRTISEMAIGPLVVRSLPIAFADLHTFDIFGLHDQPALLLGMDILSHFRRVAVDFKRREVTFHLN